MVCLFVDLGGGTPPNAAEIVKGLEEFAVISATLDPKQTTEFTGNAREQRSAHVRRQNW